MGRRIILSGVHGVGKGYFISHQLADVENLSAITASQLISSVHNPEDAGNKRVKDVKNNQAILLNGLKKLWTNHDGTFLLDGHIVILDSNDRIQRIPISFFEDGMFDTLILLQDNPRLIYDRLIKRDGFSKLSLELISDIQRQETMYAEELVKKGIEVCFITPTSCSECYMKYFETKGDMNGIQ